MNAERARTEISPGTALMSMTGFGFHQHQDDQAVYRCEIRSVNSRYLEVQVRTPRHLMSLEPILINAVKSRVERGKVDVFIECVPAKKDQVPVGLGANLKEYLDLYSNAEKQVRHQGLSVSPLDLRSLLSDLGMGPCGESKSPGAAQGLDPEEVQEKFQPGILTCLEKALDRHHESRAAEGKSLGLSLAEPLGKLKNHLKSLLEQLESIRLVLKNVHKKRLDTAIDALVTSLDPQLLKSREERLLMELALLADKQDIAEEITRLGIHLDQVERMLGGGPHQLAPKGGQGRKLDFMCQEMFREINTMSNKLLQIEVLGLTIEMKQQVEKIRQQVQNIE